jgi:DNA polymerase III gamma/tau subunit
MVLKAGIADPTLLGIPESLLPDLHEQADLFSREDLLRLFDAFQKIENGMKYATQVRFQLEMGLIELAHISKLRPLEDVIAQFAASSERETRPGFERTAVSPAPASTPQTKSPAYQTRPAPGQASAPIEGKTATHQSPSSFGFPAPEADKTFSPVPESRDFLFKIAAAVGREALESLLQSLDGARLLGERVVLDPGTSSEFVRRQVKENLPAISQAATKVVGSKVIVMLGEAKSEQALPGAQTRSEKPPENEILEKAKQEPVVRSFLDVFPGPVKAEKIES